MPLSHPCLHHAFYDDDGNIIIEIDEVDIVPVLDESEVVIEQDQGSDRSIIDEEDSMIDSDHLTNQTWESEEDDTEDSFNADQNTFESDAGVQKPSWTDTWIITDEDSIKTVSTPLAPPPVREVRHKAALWLKETLHEGHDQLQATVDDTRCAWQRLRHSPSQLQPLLVRLSAIASKPIRIGSRNARRPRTKLQLFVIDTVRFGSTFAFIFTVLFVGINYQSFWQIAKADLALGTNIETQQALEDISQQHVENALTSAIVSGGLQLNAGLVSYLPAVGPDTNFLILPKINKVIPLHDVNIDPLVRGDWAGLEKSIQDALLGGAVLYPGSAKPGDPGNPFITAHSSYYPHIKSDWKDAFALLHRLERGDRYSIYYGGDLHVYQVTDKFEVKPSNTSVLDQDPNELMSTLMTCTPVGTTLRRLIVQGKEIDPETGAFLKPGEKTATPLNPVKLEELPI